MTRYYVVNDVLIDISYIIFGATVNSVLWYSALWEKLGIIWCYGKILNSALWIRPYVPAWSVVIFKIC